jgi:hypothetical protein
MKKETLGKIFGQLTCSDDEYETEQSVFVYEFSNKKYEILVKRSEGNLINFAVKYIGEVAV